LSAEAAGALLQDPPRWFESSIREVPAISA
jgi:hypothetical protein